MKKDLPSMNQDMLDLVTQKKDSMTMHQPMPDGYIQVTCYSILPGIILALNNIHTARFPLTAEMSACDIFTINYCLDGRCEFQIDNDNYLYISNNLTSIGPLTAQDSFYYPSSHYLGYEFYVFPSYLNSQAEDILALFSIKTMQLFACAKPYSPLLTPDTLASLWNQLHHAVNDRQIGHIRLKALEIMQYLVTHPNLPQGNVYYLTKTQATLANNMKELLVKDLSQHIPVRTIAGSYGVSETSLKNYFRSVYGVTVSQYLNEARMQLAGKLLTTTTMSISEIARNCGYTNQGRFAKIFRDYYHMKPLDYRRNASIHSIRL